MFVEKNKISVNIRILNGAITCLQLEVRTEMRKHIVAFFQTRNITLGSRAIKSLVMEILYEK